MNNIENSLRNYMMQIPLEDDTVDTRRSNYDLREQQAQAFYKSIRESHDMEDSLEQLTRYGEFSEYYGRKKKVVILKDNNKVP